MMCVCVQLGSDSSVLETESKEGVARMLGHVTKVLDHLTSQRVQHFFLIKSSQMFVAPLADHVIIT